MLRVSAVADSHPPQNCPQPTFRRGVGGADERHQLASVLNGKIVQRFYLPIIQIYNSIGDKLYLSSQNFRPPKWEKQWKVYCFYFEQRALFENFTL